MDWEDGKCGAVLSLFSYVHTCGEWGHSHRHGEGGETTEKHSYVCSEERTVVCRAVQHERK